VLIYDDKDGFTEEAPEDADTDAGKEEKSEAETA
jgi:hypothetical protein